MLISWVSKYDARGTRAARKDFAALGKTALKTRVTLLATAYAFQRLATSAVSAAAAEQQSLAQLNKVLENQGFGNAKTQVSDFITAMQNSTGIIDNELRPAFVQLFNAMHDVGAAESMLAKSTDYAAGTGKSLDTVVTALSRAFAGNRESLNELNTGLDKTFLKSASMSQIITELDRKFSGSAKASVDTFAGSILRFDTAVATASETFGAGFISQFNTIGIDVAQFTDGVYNAGKAIGWLVSNTVDKGGALINWFAKLPDWFVKFVQTGLGPWSAPKWMQKSVVDPIGKLHDSITGITNAGSKETALEKYLKRLEKAQAAAAAKIAAERLAKERKITAEQKKQADLKKKQAKYDLELIGLAAALGRAQSTENRARLQELFDIAQAQYGTKITAPAGATLAGPGTILSPNAGSFRLAEQGANMGVGYSGQPLTPLTPSGLPSGGVVNNNININALSTMDIQQAVAAAVNSGSRAGLAYTQVFSRL